MCVLFPISSLNLNKAGLYSSPFLNSVGLFLLKLNTIQPKISIRNKIRFPLPYFYILLKFLASNIRDTAKKSFQTK